MYKCLYRLYQEAVRSSYDFNDREAGLFLTYRDLLIEWNTYVNLTSITDPEDIEVKHFVDSLTVIQALPLNNTEDLSVIDVGTGAGFPGLPLKILIPRLDLTLIESVGKKVAFLNNLTKQLGLADVKILHGRAEDLGREPTLRESFDVVLARAVAPLNILVEIGLPFCRQGGILVAQKKVSLGTELEDAKYAIALMGASISKIVYLEADRVGDERCLVILEKTSTTPSVYPRRAGKISKMPLLAPSEV